MLSSILMIAVFLSPAAILPHTSPAMGSYHPAPLSAEPFPLSEVRLLPGPYQHANVKCADYLLKVDPDRLLHSFRAHSGLKPKAPIYGGWEDSGLAGHSLGHYLTACAQQYAVTRDERFKAKVEYIVSELAACQASRPDGYIAAMPDGDRVWAEVKKGEIRTHGFDLNGLWSPWYTHHKVLAGLVDAYELTGDAQALQVARKFADWAYEETKALTDDQWQRMLVCEYGGMNDVLAELYSLTKDERYLELSRKFYDHRVLDPLAESRDDLPGKHSNTQIPKVIGLARLYELTGDERDRAIAKFFWETVVGHHSYAIGGNSDHEYFGPPDRLNDALSTNTCETCNTYNMLKLTRHLFEWEPRVEYADFYERAHLNDILASQNPETGMMTYFVPLVSGAHRDYSDPYDTWTCCHGTGMENHTKHADSVFFHTGASKLYVNQFIPTELSWHETGIKLKLDTNYPADGKVGLGFEQAGGKPLTLMLRHPGWAKGEMVVKLNGHVVARSADAGAYVPVEHRWKTGDHLEFVVPMALRTEPMPDNPKRIALLYGPVVLAADLGAVEGPRPRTPVLVTGERPIDHWLARVPGTGIEFKAEGIGRPAPNLTFKPFYELYDSRYAVYFDEFSEEQWDRAEAEYRAEEARQRDLEARTVDFARIGEMQPERDHNLKSESNDVRDANGRGFRTPLNGGWFELELKVDPAAPCDLVMTYWGNERFSPSFEILVDGQKLVTETLPDKKPNQFFDETHAIPAEWTKGKSKITVRVRAEPGKPAGSVAGARSVKRS
jgi:hypothetical protein